MSLGEVLIRFDLFIIKYPRVLCQEFRFSMVWPTFG